MSQEEDEERGLTKEGRDRGSGGAEYLEENKEWESFKGLELLPTAASESQEDIIPSLTVTVSELLSQKKNETRHTLHLQIIAHFTTVRDMHYRL